MNTSKNLETYFLILPPRKSEFDKWSIYENRPDRIEQDSPSQDANSEEFTSSRLQPLSACFVPFSEVATFDSNSFRPYTF